MPSCDNGTPITQPFRESLTRCFKHLSRCHACSACGTLDYAILRALGVMASLPEHNAVLLLPRFVCAPISTDVLNNEVKEFSAICRYGSTERLCMTCAPARGRKFQFQCRTANTLVSVQKKLSGFTAVFKTRTGQRIWCMTDQFSLVVVWSFCRFSFYRHKESLTVC